MSDDLTATRTNGGLLLRDTENKERWMWIDQAAEVLD